MTLGPLAVAISIDTTFRCAYKATLVDKDKARVWSHLGGFVSVINQKSQPISWVCGSSLRFALSSLTPLQRLCHSQSQTETQEMLNGLSNRLAHLELSPPEILTSDTCCQIRNTALKVFPNIQVVQDVWHFLMRYVTPSHSDGGGLTHPLNQVPGLCQRRYKEPLSEGGSQ